MDRPATVSLSPIAASAPFKDTVAPNSLNWACASTEPALQAFFRAHEVSFERNLLRRESQRLCHIYFQPTVPGFQALPEEAPVSELFVNVDTLAFLLKRSERVGDSLDTAKQILSEIASPMQLTLGVSMPFQNKYFRAAQQFHFGKSAHQLTFHYDPIGDIDPWIQDFLKSGQAGQKSMTLVTHMAFEGIPQYGEMLKPMLDSFNGPGFIRSQISFEGGDILFARLASTPGKLVMFYGAAARPYWGSSLTLAEFEYILRLEFGAAEAVYLGDLTPHLDYTLSILPNDFALLTEPVCDNLDVARAALNLLLASYDTPQPGWLRLARLLSQGQDSLVANHAQIVEETLAATRLQTAWKAPVDAEVRKRIEDYVKKECPDSPDSCISPDKIPNLLENHRPLLADWVRAGASARSQQALALRLLELIRRQASGCDTASLDKLNATAGALARMGYHVVRVPWLQGDGTPASPWPGISYVNLAAVGHTLFVPELGLGKVESEWFSRLASQLPKPYRVVPAPARSLLLGNGGIHCALAFMRDVSTVQAHAAISAAR